MDSRLGEFFELLHEAGLASSSQLTQLKSSVASREGTNPQDTATELVHLGCVTEYQASEISQGQLQKLIVGEYLLMDRIGHGGMGQVFRARHCVMRRDVAIKFLLPAREDDPESARRFRREVQTASKLSHPNIVAALDAGQRDGLSYLVMEYVDGINLSKLIQARGPMSIELTVDCIFQAALGLEYSHRHGIIHRDIKPTNLLLTEEGRIKILDLGLARIQSPLSSNAPESPSEELTEQGQFLGTIDFMAPEQALDPRCADKRADIYSLGCTMYYLLTGAAPYQGDSATHRLVAHRESPIPSLYDVRPDVPNALDQCFYRLLEKNVKDRYQDMEDVIRDLRACSRILKGLNDDSEDTTVWRESPEEQEGGALRPNRRQFAIWGGLLVASALSVWAVKRFVIGSAGIQREDEGPPPAQDDNASASLIAIEAFPADLLSIVREDRDVVAGSEWEFNPSRILTGIGKAARFQISAPVPKEYDLTLRVTRQEGAGPLIVGLATGQGQCYVLLDRGGSSGIGVDKQIQMVTSSSAITLPIGEPIVIRCLMVDSQIEVFVNEEKLLTYAGDLSQLQIPAAYRVHRDDVLFVATNHLRNGMPTRFEITQLTLNRVESME